MKKSSKLIDDVEDDFLTDKKHRRKFQDRRKEKKRKNALRTLDIKSLTELEDDEQFY